MKYVGNRHNIHKFLSKGTFCYMRYLLGIYKSPMHEK